MTQAVLFDTSALIAFFIQSEKNHIAIKNYCLRYPTHRWIILDSVFDETVAWIRARIFTKHSIQIGQALRQEHEYIHLSDLDDLATWETFCRYDDKSWSYTDCSLLVMAQKLTVFQIASFDEHIRQMAGLGVICVP